MKLATSTIFIFLLPLIIHFASCSPVSDSIDSNFGLENNFIRLEHQITVINTLKYIEPIFIDIDYLNSLRDNYKRGEEAAITVVNVFLSSANTYLASKPPSVINKENPAPSGSFNDYVSLSPYWWPVVSEDGEVTYERRDGVRNPDVSNYNKDELTEFRNAVDNLALAYFITQDLKFYNKAIEYLEVWFINAETKMNPHLQYSQFIPTVTDGRFLGIIEGIAFIKILDSIYLLRKSELWNMETELQIAAWYDAYLQWLIKSSFGKQERDYFNNHGSWYDVQVLSIASSLSENNPIIYSTLDSTATKRLSTQIDTDGSQPFEVIRSIGLHYSVYNLEALLISAKFGQKYGYDVWNFPNNQESLLESAVEFLIPFIVYNKEWEYRQINDFDNCDFRPILTMAYQITNDPYFLDNLDVLINSGCQFQN